MKHTLFLVSCLLLCSAHDLFLKSDEFYLEPRQAGELALFNGTFDRSENVITRDRIVQARIVGPDFFFVPRESDWYDAGDTTFLRFTAGGEGTYLAGMSTLPRIIELTSDDFNNYLEHDGVLDILAERERLGRLGQDARERYSKHVKALVQVGDTPTGHFGGVFGYPIEFVAHSNPYQASIGDEVTFSLLRNARPLPGQLVYVGFRPEEAHHQEHLPRHDHTAERSYRTNERGRLTVKLDHAGHWYLRTIYMTPREEEGVDYESLWATLTFAVK